ncbi:23S rRNA (uracil(1939)-C(5))-methyltransferase RlmD [Paenibacillus yanchengensis]|uniref:23S rRNA (Uracil(1939)-C(5))-methyltransferase RlmD n=1 Tax=Paenibacillus yanchengensis TaxID=2035833 RepID=A0ABW4YII8_9BACL
MKDKQTAKAHIAKTRSTEKHEGKQKTKAGKVAASIEGTRRSHTKTNTNTYPQKQSNSKAGGQVDAETIRSGDRVVITIKRIGINGEGVGYYKRKAIFINGTLPGEVVKAVITQVAATYLQAELLEIEKPSKERQTPPCPVYEKCGGCQLQHMTYKAQLQAKEEMVKEAFRRYTGMEQLPILPIIGMDDPWHYRNKAQLQLGQQGNQVIAGLYEAESRTLVDIGDCPIQHPIVNEVINKVKEILMQLNIPVYHTRTRKGIVKTVVARVGYDSGQVQLTLVTVEEKLPAVKQLIEAIREQLPMVVTIAQNINTGSTPLIFGPKTKILWGEERLSERLGELHFSLSPRAFFQLNPKQTVKLYDAALQAAQLTGKELVIDGYCGTGTIGLWMAPYAKEVRGIEIIEEAVHDARENAKTSGITNASFHTGRAEKLLPEWVASGVKPDVVVVDPPRTGCDMPLLQAIAKAKPKRVVYVSCNPSTLAKDCKYLLDNGYSLKSVQPVDMFAQTGHVEVVVGLERKKTAG